MRLPKVKRIAHVVLYVLNPEESALWYCNILGMKVSARVADGPYAGGIFLSFGVSDHDIALFPAQAGASKGQEFEHMGLEVDCGGNLEQLRMLYGHMLQQNVKICEILDHGVSIGIYFLDPDGHMLEAFIQLTPPEGGVAIQQLHDNGGQAIPITLEPLYA